MNCEGQGQEKHGQGQGKEHASPVKTALFTGLEWSGSDCGTARPKTRSDSLQIDDHRQIDRRAAPPVPTADAPPRDRSNAPLDDEAGAPLRHCPTDTVPRQVRRNAELPRSSPGPPAACAGDRALKTGAIYSTRRTDPCTGTARAPARRGRRTLRSASRRRSPRRRCGRAPPPGSRFRRSLARPAARARQGGAAGLGVAGERRRT